ncbi:MAG: iron-sulfur cluster assembly scaffold protein [Proteobacteria bacterium]|nr:iron-sulfur cluster assembly scaffold protein [Pseudomonadota bacterium]
METNEKSPNSPQTGYTDEFLTHAFSPQNVGVISDPDGFGAPRGACGDTLEIGLRVRNDRIADLAFLTDGCQHTVACGSVVTTLARDKTVQEALQIDAEAVMDMLGGLPPDHVHCARLAVTTLRLALKDYLKNRQAPWKKLYRT